MAALCRFCHVETFIGDAHPCCLAWEARSPGERCQACAVPRPARRQTSQLAYDVLKPFRCPTCGLSESGYERLSAAGFDPRPCVACAGQFAPSMAVA